jgi:O-antigen/teichoic acid export membrane protein
MGIVKKQAYKNTIISYMGMVIGYVNVLLYAKYLFVGQYGLFSLLQILAVLYSLIAGLGVPSIIIKYFPFFKTDDHKHNGFFFWVARLALLSFALVTILYIIAKPVFADVYKDKDSVLFMQYFYVLIPLSAFIVAFNIFEATGKVIYNTIYSGFLNQLLLKVLTTVDILLYGYHVVSFQQFILIYVAINGLIALLLLISLIATRQFKLSFKTPRIEEVKNAQIVYYGLFALVSSSVYILWQKADIAMLSAMKGLEITGAYNFYSQVAIVISIPAQALSRTTYQIIADSWKSKNMQPIGEVYSKTSIVQMVFGCLLFVGILVNKYNLFNIIHNKDYTTHFEFFIAIGLGFLIDITGGLNTFIMSSSHKYRLTTLMVIVSSILCFGLTYIMIGWWGGLGAAIAYLIVITLFNFATWFYIKTRFRLQPFTYKHLLVILIAAISFLAGKYLWTIPNAYADLVVRSIVTGGIYMILTYSLHISGDINDKIDGTFQKALKYIK